MSPRTSKFCGYIQGIQSSFTARLFAVFSKHGHSEHLYDFALPTNQPARNRHTPRHHPKSQPQSPHTARRRMVQWSPSWALAAAPIPARLSMARRPVRAGRLQSRTRPPCLTRIGDRAAVGTGCQAPAAKAAGGTVGPPPGLPVTPRRQQRSRPTRGDIQAERLRPGTPPQARSAGPHGRVATRHLDVHLTTRSVGLIRPARQPSQPSGLAFAE